MDFKDRGLGLKHRKHTVHHQGTCVWTGWRHVLMSPEEKTLTTKHKGFWWSSWIKGRWNMELMVPSFAAFDGNTLSTGCFCQRLISDRWWWGWWGCVSPSDIYKGSCLCLVWLSVEVQLTYKPTRERNAANNRNRNLIRSMQNTGGGADHLLEEDVFSGSSLKTTVVEMLHRKLQRPLD